MCRLRNQANWLWLLIIVFPLVAVLLFFLSALGFVCWFLDLFLLSLRRRYRTAVLFIPFVSVRTENYESLKKLRMNFERSVGTLLRKRDFEKSKKKTQSLAESIDFTLMSSTKDEEKDVRV